MRRCLASNDATLIKICCKVLLLGGKLATLEESDVQNFHTVCVIRFHQELRFTSFFTKTSSPSKHGYSTFVPDPARDRRCLCTIFHTIRINFETRHDNFVCCVTREK